MANRKCPCGRPLHYTISHVQRMVEQQIAELGECIKVTVGGRSFMVPRHFIALHGTMGHTLPRLAAQYGFEEVTGRA